MNRYQYIKNIGIEKLSSYLCDEMEKLSNEMDRDACYVCPVYHKCDIGHNAWLAWLKEDINIEHE